MSRVEDIIRETPADRTARVKAEMEASRANERRLLAAIGKPLIVGLEEFLSEPPDDAPMIVGQGVLPRSSLSLVAGEGGTGKTSLVVQLALSIAAGIPFLGFEVSAGPILFLEAEGNRDKFRERVDDCRKSFGISGDAPVSFQRLGVALSIDSEELCAMICAAEAQLVVLDTVGLFHDGEEGSNTDFKRRVVKPLRQLIGETGCAFLLIHHFGKPNEDRKGRHRVRGASAMVDDVESALLLEKAKTDPQARVLTFDKLRHGAPLDPLVLSFDQERAVFERTNLDAVTAMKPRLAEVQRIVLARGELATKMLLAAIQDELGLGRSQAEDLVASAYYSGLISRPRRGFYAPVGGLLAQRPGGDGRDEAEAFP